ncbi:hypothetical protein QT995_01635 [Microcoleus sp. S36b_A3]
MVITKIIFRLEHERSSQVNFTIDTAIACFLEKPLGAGDALSVAEGFA